MLLDVRSRRQYNELVIGFVGAVGIESDFIRKEIELALERVGYPTELVHLIELLHEIDKWESGVAETPEEDRIWEHMDAGDEFRQLIDSGDALAILGIGQVQKLRGKLTGSVQTPPKRQAYIFKSLKHPEELVALREVYGPNFIAIGAYSPRETRVSNLAERIAQTDNSIDVDKYRDKAEKLVTRDLKDSSRPYGQDVRTTFPLVDVFVDSSEPSQARNQIRRFMELLFGHQLHTPTRDEHAMFHALAAALRSGSLSRQVGAVITTSAGDIVSVGTNEVPKHGGGQYWCDDDPIYRDIEKMRDSSDEIKRMNVAEVLDRIASEAGWLGEKLANMESSARLRAAVKFLRDTRVMQPLEFGRAVHAEMAAVVDAARRGISIDGGILYTTTFPCHECARHIVAAGIQRAVYIEPYPKSLAAQLHEDEIAVESKAQLTGKVRFDPFVGVAPRQYVNLFSMIGDRKDSEGQILDWRPSDAVLRQAFPPEAYIVNETDALAELNSRMKRAKLNPVLAGEAKHA